MLHNSALAILLSELTGSGAVVLLREFTQISATTNFYDSGMKEISGKKKIQIPGDTTTHSEKLSV